MVFVLRQQVTRVTIGGRIQFVTGDGYLKTVSASLSEQDRASQCSFEVFDPGLRFANLLLVQFQEQGGILTPDGLLAEIKQKQSGTVTAGGVDTGAESSVSGYPRGDDLARVIVSECIKYKVSQREQVAYVLATVEHESAMGRYREEIGEDSYFNRYDIRFNPRLARTLGNTQPGDGVRFKGRGYVQITGRRNYTIWAKKLGIDLVTKPELAAEPKYAIPILVLGMKEGSFTGRSLNTYIRPGKVDYYNARRIINGTDRASLIAGYARKWAGRLDSLGYSSASSDSTPPEPQSGREILNSLSSPSVDSQPTEITLEQGTIIKVEIGFNDSTATSFEYYLTGIKTTSPDTTRITGKQLRFLVGQAKKISAVTQNTSLNQWAKKIQRETGVKISVPSGNSKTEQVVQAQESDYEVLLKLASKAGLFVRGDTREIKLEPLKIGEKTYTVGRIQVLPGSYWGDEASTSRVIKGSTKTTSNLQTPKGGNEILGELAQNQAQSSTTQEGILAIDSALDPDKGIGKGFPGRVLIDPYRTPDILHCQPGHLLTLSPSLGLGAALSRQYRIGEVTHELGQTILDIYLPVAVTQKASPSVPGNQPSTAGTPSNPGAGLSLKGEFKTPLKQGEKVAGFQVTSPYGMRTHPITGQRRLHGGVDIGCPAGTPFYVICKPGESVEVRRAFSTTGGNMAIFEYDGYKFYYLHCSQVAANGTYSYGQAIARCGSTGSSTAPHLHFTQKQTAPTETVEPMRGYVFACLSGKFPG